MRAGTYNLTIEQGSEFDRTLTWYAAATPEEKASGATHGSPIDLTGMTARMKIKTLTGKLIVSLSTTDDSITLGGAEGTITLHLSGATTAEMTFVRGKYDLELVDSLDKPHRLVEGEVTLSLETTD